MRTQDWGKLQWIVIYPKVANIIRPNVGLTLVLSHYCHRGALLPNVRLDKEMRARRKGG